MPKAKVAAQKAVELDPTLAEGYASLGLVKFFYDWDWPEAEREFRRALELNPNSAEARIDYAWPRWAAARRPYKRPTALTNLTPSQWQFVGADSGICSSRAGMRKPSRRVARWFNWNPITLGLEHPGAGVLSSAPTPGSHR
jgi:tetratricopeptide (TPR) repeat protein